jgi:hypothetical protein
LHIEVFMLRYLCNNPNCLNTFLSADLLKSKKCELCGSFLTHLGKPENATDSPANETIKELKVKYVKLREKAFRIGLLEHECIIVGRAIRKLSFEMRKKLLQDAGLWEEDIIYKHVMIDGLLKMIPDKRKMYYERKKREK